MASLYLDSIGTEKPRSVDESVVKMTDENPNPRGI
jgi:hypothetical protein